MRARSCSWARSHFTMYIADTRETLHMQAPFSRTVGFFCNGSDAVETTTVVVTVPVSGSSLVLAMRTRLRKHALKPAARQVPPSAYPPTSRALTTIGAGRDAVASLRRCYVACRSNEAVLMGISSCIQFLRSSFDATHHRGHLSHIVDSVHSYYPQLWRVTT